MTEQEKIIDPQENLQKNRNLMKRYLAVFVLAGIVFISYSIGFARGKDSLQSETISKNVSLDKAFIENQGLDPENAVDFSLFWKVWDILKDKHIDKKKINAQDLLYGSINGMLRATGDPYTYFFNPEESKRFSEDIEGSFEGIGAELGIRDNLLTVIAPLEDSPAQKAGLRPGDKILKIDDKVSTDFSIDEAVGLIRGEKGTSVKLTILSSEEDEPREVSVIRGIIEVKSVKLDFLEGNVAHLKITGFGENTLTEFNEATSRIISQNSRGIILDLRNNPGGLLNKTVEIAEKMIPKGSVVVIEEYGEGDKESLRTGGGDKLSSFPMVVLINEGSASASEILAGALRDNREIALIGKKTFGKGTVQQLIDLKGGSSVKITVAKWMTPAGEYIAEKGIAPVIEVDLTREDFENERDPQLDRAREEIGRIIGN